MKLLGFGFLVAQGAALANVNVEVAVTHDSVTQSNSAVVAADQAPAVIFNDGVISVEGIVTKDEKQVQLIVVQEDANASKEVIAAPVLVVGNEISVLTLADDNGNGVEIKVSKENIV